MQNNEPSLSYHSRINHGSQQAPLNTLFCKIFAGYLFTCNQRLKLNANRLSHNLPHKSNSGIFISNRWSTTTRSATKTPCSHLNCRMMIRMMSHPAFPAEESELPPQSTRPSMMDSMQSRRTGLQAKMLMVKSGTSRKSRLMETHSPSALMAKW